MKDPIVKFHNVTYYYPGTNRPAIEGVNFTIEKGETVLITGPSGAGKSTLCYMLNGIIPNSYGGDLQGQVLVNSMNIAESTIGELAFTSGLLFQDPSGQLIASTVEDEIAFGPENRGLSVEEINEIVEKYINYVNMKQFSERPPQALSGGQQQLVAFASILAMEPEIYILDEPTSNLDPLGSEMIFQLMKRIAKELNKTVILVEHKIDKVINLVDRIIVMDKGRIIYDGLPKDVMSNYERLIDIGVIPPQITQITSMLRDKKGLDVEVKTSLEEGVEELKKVFTSDRMEKIKEEEINKQFKSFRTFKDVAIEVKDLHFGYTPEVEVLHGVNLKVYDGEFLSIIGQNGSGKTTLVKHLNGLLRPISGEILIYGESTKDKTIAYLSTKVGYCFQNPDHQIFSSRTWDEIAYGPRNLGYEDDKVEELVKYVSEILGIEDLLDENPYNLSKGQRQQIAVASILAMQPNIIIVDEPTTGQDPKQSRSMMDLMKSLNREHNKTIVVITHDMNIAAEYSDRLVVMHSGNVLVEGTPRQVFAHEELLRKSNLEPPQIAKAALRLGLTNPLPIDLDEAEILIDQILEVRSHG